MVPYRVTLHSGGKEYDFQFIGGPIDDLDDSAPLFEALGFIAASWARLEQHIDAILLHVNDRSHSAEIYNPDHPVSFRQTIKLFKRWFNQHPALANFTDEVRELTRLLKSLSDDRNTMLHSILETWTGETQTGKFRAIKYDGDDNFRIINAEYTLKALAAFAVQVNLANRRLALISSQIFTNEALGALAQPQTRARRIRGLIRRLLRYCGGSKS